MKLLICSHCPLTKELGTPKALLELSEPLRELGWQCDVRGRNHILDEVGQSTEGLSLEQSDLAFARASRVYLQRHAADYDVVEYEHSNLPFARTDFSPTTLMVAKSLLLVHHGYLMPANPIKSVKDVARHLLLRARAEAGRRQRELERAILTTEQADLINVNNTDAVTELVRHGISAEKIVVLAYAIDEARRQLFDAVSSEVPAAPVVAFVGTFDPRKGANDFPALVSSIVKSVPATRFRLLGTAGLFASAEQVSAFFPASLRERIEIVPRFQSDDLPELLRDCSVGVFPSYWEGFGFGVLEMMAASVPVVAYDAPGPPMMLPPSYLVKPGDVAAMSARVVELLRDPQKLAQARVWAKQRSQDFRWTTIARETSEVYLHHLELLRSQVAAHR